MTEAVRIRRIADGDWPGIVALESRAYAPLGLSEGREALESRAGASPGTCFALDLGRQLAGYLLALPYPESAYPELDGPERGPTLASRNLHLHDIVVAEHLRHRGLARHLLRHLMATARAHGYEQISLVAVGGSETFWAGRGFTAHAGPPPSGYGPTAVYMSRTTRPATVPAREPEKWADAGAPRA
ncbi:MULTISPECIES: GNAT family N-acetyltransferase [unclassified Streptomyces]|uniref:GNAT family N-acetyltransferase n=1 Tax=unclassified Streptomyces TaxID=2593676 RepID=UPI00228613A0|nr:GNAT family N-acetyltransferase [Streptomyces sp. Je 1-369]WAL93787.1 GNAT family N-acetyltransferase [Streptomyces sp. Je 1-369]